MHLAPLDPTAQAFLDPSELHNKTSLKKQNKGLLEGLDQATKMCPAKPGTLSTLRLYQTLIALEPGF